MVCSYKKSNMGEFLKHPRASYHGLGEESVTFDKFLNYVGAHREDTNSGLATGQNYWTGVFSFLHNFNTFLASG